MSRGGKRKYFLTDKFIKRYLISKHKPEDHTDEALKIIKELLSNTKIGDKTKSKLYEVEKLLEDSL